MKRITSILSIIILAIGCKPKADQVAIDEFCKGQLPEWNMKLTSVIMGDVLSPPVCSRIYAYTNIAAYEALLPENKSYKTFAGRLNGLTAVPNPDINKKYCYPIASIIAFITVAQKLVFNADAVKERQAAYLKQLDSIGIDKGVLANSIQYGQAVGQHILAWAGKDGYLQRTSFGGYLVTKQPGRWIPTPPDYMDATENNWKNLRPFVMDSAAQFRPGPPIKYDTTEGSVFHKEAMKVYDEVTKPNVGDSAIAWYWDDNPNTSITDGHITYFLQKVSPPGHWVYIACSVAEKEKLSAIKTAALLSKTAIAVFDAIVSVWEAKYTYNLLRPESFINTQIDPKTFIKTHIDKSWQPLIQTPPFPEYPGGHSSISASAATVLTDAIGNNYSFTDSTEVPFGRPARHFSSFYEAAAQASISRFYGGIHFYSSLAVGADMGRKIGSYVIQKLN